MKMTRKYLIICCCILFAILVLFYIVNENQSQKVIKNQIEQLPLSNEYVDTKNIQLPVII